MYIVTFNIIVYTFNIIFYTFPDIASRFTLSFKFDGKSGSQRSILINNL